MIIGEGKYPDETARIVDLEMELSKSREEVYRLKKAFDRMCETNEKLSAEISELRHLAGISPSDTIIDYEVTNE